MLIILLLLTQQIFADDIKPTNVSTVCPFKPQQIVRPTTTIKLSDPRKFVNIEVSSDNVFIIADKKAPKENCAVVHNNKIYFTPIDNLQIWNPVVSLKNYPKLMQDCVECDYTATDKNIIDDQCPLDKIKSGAVKWSLEVSEKVVKNCAQPEVKVIPRENDSKYCPQRRPQDLSFAESWKACPPPKECDSKEQAYAEQIGSLTLELDRARCKAPVNQKKIDQIRAQLLKMVPPKCIESFTETPNKLVIHHSALSPLIGPDGLQKSHVEGRGFADIGYHYVIAQTTSGEWKVFEGRAKKYKGAHVGAGLNSDSIGVVVAGNYAAKKPSALNPAGDKPLPPPEAVLLLMSVVNKIKNEFPVQKIYPHRSLKEQGSGCSTECPSEGCIHVTDKLNERYFK